MSEIVTITQSEIKALDMCPKKWWFGYSELLGSKKPRRALDVGTATHNAIEAYYAAKRDNKPYITSELLSSVLRLYDEDMMEFLEKGGYPPTEEQQESDKALIRSMVHQYIAYAEREDDFTIKSLEEQFDIPVINPFTGETHENLRLMGKIDGWVQIRDCNYLMEHKTAARIEADYWWPHLDQIDIYSYALQRKHGVTFTGAILNVIMKKIPSTPKLLKGGKGISKTLGSTTADVFKRAIKDFGLDIDNFTSKLAEINSKPNPFILRKILYRSARDLVEIERKIWYCINRKINLKYFPKTRTDKCNYMCSFKDLCIDDNELVREELYYVKEKAHVELEEQPKDATS